MNNYHITDIKWFSPDYDLDEDETVDEQSDLPTEVIVQTIMPWSEELNELIFEALYERYEWEPQSMNHDDLEDEDLLEELEVIEL